MLPNPHKFYLFTGYVSDECDPVAHRQGVTLFDKGMQEALFGRINIRCGFCCFKGEKECTFFDSLSIFGMDTNQPGFRFIGIEHRDEYFRFDHGSYRYPSR